MLNSKNLSRIITVLVLIIVVIAIILLLKGNGLKGKIELIGQDNIVIYQYDKYIEPGYNIVDVSNSDGFYVNIDGFVNTNKIGAYYLKYSLYNKSGKLVSTAERQVIVLEDKTNSVIMQLNGEEEEYYFVDDYVDNGAFAFQKNKDISNQIIVDSNVNASEVGKYEVKYQIVINNKIKEIVRRVNIINYNIQEDVDITNLKINLLIDCDNYYYTLLPDGTKEYSKDISYSFSNIGNYEFDIYLKNGSHKKYNIDISTIDKEGPSGTCSLYHDNNKTTITMNVIDKSGISKYSYNGLEFYGNQTIINSMVTNVTVRAYDNQNNYTDIKCKSVYGTGFRNVDVYDNGRVKDKNGWIVCGTSVSNDSKKLDELMKSYGYKTRDAVAAAGLYLATYKYDIPYFWGGKTVVKGLDPTWGCRKSHTTSHACSKSMSADNSYCAYGLDCAGFTRWAFVQAGFDSSILRGENQTEKNWGDFDARAHRYSFNSNNIYYINQIKPGDIIHRDGHVGLIIGVSDSTLQVAEMLGPIFVSTVDKYTGRGLSMQKGFTDFVLFDDFYKMYGN